MALDLDRLAKVLAMCASSHEPEALTAIRLATRLMQDAGTSWSELLQPQHNLEIAIAACRRLQDENERLKELQGHQVPALWNELGSCQDKAVAAIDAHSRGQLRLSNFEVSFLTTISDWRGALTRRQQDVFDSMMPAIARRLRTNPQWSDVA